jgi:hypothetical protein
MSPPDFIIAGAMRSGTTALADALACHPGVFMTEPKEPSYFTYRHGGESFSGPGDQWFARQNTATWSDYQALFRTAGDRVSGEASALYLAVPECIPDIASSCPDARIVLVLRDPVRRAFSAWLYLRSKGREHLTDVEAALDAEAARRDAGYGPMWWLAGASRYDVGLARFYEEFPADRIRVVLTEELRAAPETAVRDTCAFLGVPFHEGVVTALTREVNRGGEPRSRGLTRLLYPPDRVRGALSSVAPTRVRSAVRGIRASSLTRTNPAMPEPVRQRLLAQLGDVGPRVAELSGADTGRFWSTD